MFGFILEDILRESVGKNDIEDAIVNHKRVIINYQSKTVDIADGPRMAEVYAYGTSKAGNDVIRVFQPYGDTASKVPSWKLMRVDGIIGWKETGQVFSRPASDYYKGYGDFNPNGDRSMAAVYMIAKFGDDEQPMAGKDDLQANTNPKRTSDVYKTDTEKNFERLKQQMASPVKLSDFKAQKGFEGYKKPQLTTGPKKKEEPPTQQNTQNNLSLDQFRQRIGDTSKPISPNELRKRLSEPEQPQQIEQPEENKSELYRTDTERGLENLRKQLENPRKIDLDKIPKR